MSILICYIATSAFCSDLKPFVDNKQMGLCVIFSMTTSADLEALVVLGARKDVRGRRKMECSSRKSRLFYSVPSSTETLGLGKCRQSFRGVCEAGLPEVRHFEVV